MQFRSPMLDMYRKLTAEVVATTTAALPIGSAIIGEDKRPDAVRSAATTWRPIPTKLKTIDDALMGLSDKIFAISTNGDLNDNARLKFIGQATTDYSSIVNGTAFEILATTRKLLGQLRAASYPARPQPVDAAQEAALLGIKGDLQMVLAAFDKQALLNKMGDLLARANTDGDTLTSWLLASSRWPEDYLISRRLDIFVPAWSSTVAQALDRVSPAELASLRATYKRVSNPQSGLPVLEVLLSGTIKSVLEDAATAGLQRP